MSKDMTASKGIFDVVFTVKNIAICFILTVVILFTASWVAVLSSLPEAAVSLCVSVITYFCVGVCGFRSARHSGNNGLISGAIAGLVYVILLYFIGSIAFTEFVFSVSTALTALICVLCGAIGGIIGVNTKTKKRR